MPLVDLRPMRRDDLPMLLSWLRAPHVREWWRDEPSDLVAVEAKYGPCIDGADPTELFIIAESGRAIGMIQRYLLADEPDWAAAFDGIHDVTGAAGIDYLIGDVGGVGRGLGTATVEAMTALIWDWRPVSQVVVTVQQSNPASWRILEKAGYQRLWAGELDSDDPSDDGPEYLYAITRP